MKEKFPKKTMVFAGTWDGRIFDVLFVRGTMNSASYQAHVKNVCIPKLKQENGGSLQGITWQQDGANIHRNPKFMDYLDKEFDGHVLGLGADLNGRGGHSWAPRSPDLTVLDFAIWPIMKSRVYLHPRPTTLEELEEKILQVVRELNEDPDLIRRCHQSVKKRAQLCLENNGSHCEYTK
ncbi:uncharacterized protein LOC111704850 isoform X2 [Eurytemora carolleeae]|uniref:uncharacterized protein LOC111704850 isoform X2 n=1 Tax=Eurytemora carolleeae TaxID=1294199 RepID=UPI000C77E462|nr:uncharacterized protein LOC111704850 isoform X2 [Eurytemora carolleeae]|eukprot:XP_023332979.1 uncharacterized protein LOC111704850 isoform X2 [Eurytemora affinis]